MNKSYLVILTTSLLFISLYNNTSATTLQLATFAGGCFWCMEADFDKVTGVYSTTSVYTGGDRDDIPYNEASAGIHGHAEAVVVLYDPDIVTYQQLLDHYWRNIDPTVDNKQFCDEGRQYRTHIFYHTEEQRKQAEAYKEKLIKSKKFKKIYTQITAAGKLYKAEPKHQDYHIRNPMRYKYYRYTCGRDKRLEEIWQENK